jgi:translation initiation factor 5B
MKERIRQPVVVVLGHVDCGKTSLLDKIRGTAVQIREIGGMTQHIGASFFPPETLKKICGQLLNRLKGELRIPGLLVIDTPGHEVFTNLRNRGGSAADLSILVIDALRGFEMQTYESIEILRNRKVPFIIALNKVDQIPGWRQSSSTYLSESIQKQDRSVIDKLDEQIYRVVGTLSQLGFVAEAFYRVKDFAHEISIVPVSAKTGEGIPELLMVLVGLAQHYLKGRLEVILGDPKGIILEVKEEMGLGHTANVILLDGILKIGHNVAFAKREGVVMSKIKAIFMPKPLDEMRDPRDKFTPVNNVVAAAGVKIITPDLEGVLAGSPLIGFKDPAQISKVGEIIKSDIQDVLINTDKIGVIIKSDTIGSLEAIIEMLRNREIPIRRADIGPVTRREVIEACSVKDTNTYYGVVLVFGVKILPDAREEAENREVKIFSGPVIYNLITGYCDWIKSEKESMERKEFSSIMPPGKFLFLKDLIFRRNNPAIFGIEVLSGKLRHKVTLMNQKGEKIGTVLQIQDKKEKVTEADTGAQVAISVQGPTVGRQINEGDILYALPNQEETKLLLKKFTDKLSEEENRTLMEIIEIKRKSSPLWAF